MSEADGPIDAPGRDWLTPGALLLAPPVAWALANAGFGLPVTAPVNDLAWLALGAVAEEVVFRGGLQRWALDRPALALRHAGLSRANLLASAAFAAVHLVNHTPLVALGVLPVSLLLGAVYERSGRLRTPIALHLWFNGCLYAATVAPFAAATTG